jgi:hypothetical protein
MANNHKKQQRKLARRKKVVAKAKKESAKLNRSLSGSKNISFAANAPIHECLVPDDIFERGLGQVLISRKLPNGNIAIGMFLLDVFCLGVKDAFARVLTFNEYENLLNQLKENQDFHPVEPAYARKLVETAESFAKNIGFSPHPDYVGAKKIFGNIDITECQQDFTFGQEGKPMYINGPFESPNKIRKILETLTIKLGPDGFNFVFIPPDFMEEDLEDEDLEDEDFEDEDFEDEDLEDEDFEDEDLEDEDFEKNTSNKIIDIKAETAEDNISNKQDKK